MNWNPPDWNMIRRHYAERMDRIIEAGALMYGADPYSLESLYEMTPIERSMWSDIRCMGLVFYPQFPVGRFFVDFGNPVSRVAIECDGKGYHDANRDRERDEDLARLGWRVYRMSGSACNKCGYDSGDEFGRAKWNGSPGEELLAAIRKNHGM